ncbi:hypothetical protein BJY16_007308 [Actinoplanes octamycinicus]|uniref:Uncharacterized protein n=1 Tax=Actinoplanes octamycinicus TaxID=135948 RepID=A0A7W7H4V5_9ACTN|nr:hypothetical protein [Actinoplanes octamycinicus]MBB4743849.1 hypothetical protein [Actinoplanes octamycinicus]GIE58478.1 hypothetical protein Aoc01nite_38800 [Actinoplanes octamycinicus]
MTGRRLAAFAGTVGLLVAVLAGGAASAPRKGSLTYSTTLIAPADRSFVLLADGPPPAGAGHLVNAEGLKQVAVAARADPNRTCGARGDRTLGFGSDRWCVRLTGLTAGDKYTGTLLGDRTEVSLTAQARHPWWLPALVATGVFALAVGVAWLVGTWAPAWMTVGALWRELRRAGGIGGLPAWADAAAGRYGKAFALNRIQWARREGVPEVRAIRTRLGQAIADLPGCPLKTEAQHEVARGQEVLAADLLTDDGNRAVCPAELLLTAVDRAVAGLTEFHRLITALKKQISDPDLIRKTDNIVALADKLTKDLKVTGIDAYLRQLEQWVGTVRSYTAPDNAPMVAAILAGSALPVTIADQARRAASAAVTGVRYASYALPVVLGGLVLMAAAVLTVLASLYLPNPVFGDVKDYLALAATSFGSAQVAALLTLLLYLRGPDAWRPVTGAVPSGQ